MNRRHTLISACLGLFAALTLSLASAAPTLAQSGPLAFPGALGWASATPGGRGGEIIRVTNLNSEGPGSLRAAIEAEGPRIVVFEVGGVIDLEMKTLRLRNPYITIAGQTAPPGRRPSGRRPFLTGSRYNFLNRTYIV